MLQQARGIRATKNTSRKCNKTHKVQAEKEVAIAAVRIVFEALLGQRQADQ